MKIVRKSPLTGQINTMEISVTEEQFNDWYGGMLIQNAMPNLTDDEREFIMTGYTPEDWEAMFGKED